ncbi:MAG TPA: putative toxin-antitoxin system toxin component, PIN family [Nodosilinea sp.]|nr:putative toxin-antitoxin system toxin component, PIN family [Nodosilinea sp.]
MLKVIVNTSVFIAGILSSNSESSSFQLLEAWERGRLTLVISPQLLRELVVVLLRRGILEADLEEFVETITLVALHIPGAYETAMLDDIDPDDNKFLAAAYEAKADFLISLDSDLLNLKFSHGTQIVTPAAFLDLLADGRT